MSVFESIERYPTEYLPTGDKALLVAWAVVPSSVGDISVSEVQVVLCLEDGRAVQASLGDIKFDYRYDYTNQTWLDVSKIFDGPTGEGDHADTDQEAGDDGGAPVQGQVPDADPTSPGDPGSQP